MAIGIFLFFVGGVLALSFLLGRKAKSAKGYYAAHGQIPWFINGVAFAGDYLSAASFLGICGMIALYGYDGFLYSIGFLAGWIVALLIIAEPMKRMGRFTFADALDSKFHSRGIKLAAAFSTLVISVFYLIPQMVGAGALVKPLLGVPDIYGILIVGALVTTIVVTAGMVSTTWVQFLKGSLLVIVCFILTLMILHRGLDRQEIVQRSRFDHWGKQALLQKAQESGLEQVQLPAGWNAEKYLVFRNRANGSLTAWRQLEGDRILNEAVVFAQAQTRTTLPDHTVLLNGATPPGKNSSNSANAPNDANPGTLRPGGGVFFLAEGHGTDQSTGPLGPISFLTEIQKSSIVQWKKEEKTLKDSSGAVTEIFYPILTPGSKLMTPGNHPIFAGIRSPLLSKKLDFLSFMLALFCGTASLPHILIRYYTVKDQASARNSTLVGIAVIGFFYLLTLYLGFGAMVGGSLDVTDATGNQAAPLLAKSFSPFLFSLISAIAFTTVLGTVSGLILAGSGAVAHDLMENVFKIKMNDHQKVRAGKITAVFLGIGAMILGIQFKDINVGYLVAWAFNVAASANLPALIMLLYWKRTTKQGIAAAITVGVLSSVAWILVSEKSFKDVYHYSAAASAAKAMVPFSNPALVTIPLGFLVLIVVSLCTAKPVSLAAELEEPLAA